MKKPSRNSLPPNQSSYRLFQVVVFSLIILRIRTKGDAKECYNCYSTDKEGCMEPYYGRYQYNSNILIPNCNYDMARNFHSSLTYLLTKDTHETKVTKVDEEYISKWDGLSKSNSFYCCKGVFDVKVVDKISRYVVRGCCCAPATYDQCTETSTILKKMSEVAFANTTYTLHHCSSCGSDRCNSSSTSIVHGLLTTIFVIAVLVINMQRCCNFVSNKIL